MEQDKMNEQHKIYVPDNFTNDDLIFTINQGAKFEDKAPHGKYLLYANEEVIDYVNELWAINSTQK